MGDWKEGLTVEQVEIVERAARAAWTRGHGEKLWYIEPSGVRDEACADALAILRKSDHPAFPAPPAKSRGEVVAEESVKVEESLLYPPFRVVGPHAERCTRHICVSLHSRDLAESYAKTMRAGWAKIIDAERAAAYAEGVEDAAKLALRRGWDETAAEIRALPAKGVSK